MQLRSKEKASTEGAMGGAASVQMALSGPVTPLTRWGPRHKKRTKNVLELPDEVLHQIVARLTNPKDLCCLQRCSKRLCSLVEGSGTQWRGLFQDAYGEITQIQERAAELAGSWQSLFKSRRINQLEAAPWDRPSPFEVKASIESMIFRNSASISLLHKASVDGTSMEAAVQEESQETCIMFLVDGSGSVTEADFGCMLSFILGTAEHIIDTKRQCIRLGILQFSNEVRVELAPTLLETDNGEVFTSVTRSMQRMNGGTNIALAVQKAGQLFKGLGPATRRVIALLSDGRIDSYQAREAHDMASRLADEQGSLALHAFGVGRGVDRYEMLRIVRGTCGDDDARGRYLPLMVLDDAPWLGPGILFLAEQAAAGLEG